MKATLALLAPMILLAACSGGSTGTANSTADEVEAPRRDNLLNAVQDPLERAGGVQQTLDAAAEERRRALEQNER